MTHLRTARVLVLIGTFLLGGLAAALLHQLDGSSNSTIEGSGVPATQARRVAAFHGVELAGSNNVAIRVGVRQSVVVKADRNLLDRVTTKVESGVLVVGDKPGSFTTKSPMSVEVSVPTLTAVTLSGSGNIAATGTATRLDVELDGSGDAQLMGIVADDVRATLSGSGNIFVTARQSLDASISGSGSILYTGNPQHVTRNVSGSGTISGG